MRPKIEYQPDAVLYLQEARHRRGETDPNHAPNGGQVHRIPARSDRGPLGQSRQVYLSRRLRGARHGGRPRRPNHPRAAMLSMVPTRRVVVSIYVHLMSYSLTKTLACNCLFIKKKLKRSFNLPCLKLYDKTLVF